MANSNGMITAPVSIQDVRQVLGNSSTDLGTLCKASQINMWAKYKPIYHSEVGLLKNSQRQNSGHSVSGYAISWGVMKPAVSSWLDYIDTSNGVVKSGMWGYDRPQGGAASPYRLADFVEISDSGVITGNGYSHSAKCPIQITLSQESYLYVPYYPSTGDGTTLMFLFTFQTGVNGWYETHSLKIGEIFASELSYYPTVIFTCYYNGRIYEYARSSDNTVSYYTGNVNPIVQVPIDTKVLAQSVLHDGGSDHSGALADGAKWTACMVLVRDKVAGTTTQHTINNNQIRRLEYSTGVDRKEMTVKNTSSLDYITALSYVVTLKKSSSNSNYYYMQSIDVTITTTSGDSVSFNVSSVFTCLIGVIGGTGWDGDKSTDGREQWATVRIDISERGRTVTKTISPINSYPEFRFSGSLPGGERVAAGDVTFTDGSLYLPKSSFSIRVDGGADTYTQTVVVK